MKLQQHHEVGTQGTTHEIEPCFEQRTARFSAQVAPTPSQDQHVTVSHVDTLWHNVEDQQINAVVPVPRLISADLRALLTCLGMSDGALVSWHSFHVSPVRAMLHFFISSLILLAALSYLQYGTPLIYVYISIPCICTITFISAYTVAIWRHGPAAAKHRVYIMTLPVSWMCWATAFLARCAFQHKQCHQEIEIAWYCVVLQYHGHLCNTS
jgi:hypothetical protein